MPHRRTQRRRRALFEAAQRAISARYAEFGLTVDDVAQEVGTSRRQLQRVLRELGNEDFRAQLLRVRMERARVLLSRTKKPLWARAVARMVGYREASGLRQAFKRYFGVNPSEFRPGPLDYDVIWRAAEVRTKDELASSD